MTMIASTSSPEGLRASYASPGRRRQREQDSTVFGYAGTPDVPTLNREVFKWVQGLDLSHSLKHVRRDVQNGFLVAEIFSRYFPADIKMHGFANATSSHYKRDNWMQLQQFCNKQNLPLPTDLVEGTAAGLHGAGEALLEHLYTVFTGKKVQRAVAPTGLQGATVPDANATRGASDGTTRAIATALAKGAPIEFGAVTTSAVSVDAAALRRKLAGGA
mmetsp:Transcript_4227/g.10569  ORF Transcript_4227/g.10569 Transcript_4227/m.10569 type:complete len:217 (-) Transcript_4227:345-995(-)